MWPLGAFSLTHACYLRLLWILVMMWKTCCWSMAHHTWHVWAHWSCDIGIRLSSHRATATSPTLHLLVNACFLCVMICIFSFFFLLNCEHNCDDLLEALNSCSKLILACFNQLLVLVVASVLVDVLQWESVCVYSVLSLCSSSWTEIWFMCKCPDFVYQRTESGYWS